MAILLNQGVTRKLRSRGLLLEAISQFDTTVDIRGSEQANQYRWLDGVSWLPRLCTGPNVLNLDPCAGGFGEVVIPSNCQPWVTQRPFQIIDALKGSTLSFSIEDLDELLEEREEETLSWAFAKALLGPVLTSGQHTLSESAHNPLQVPFGTAAVSLTKAIETLERDLASTLFGVQGIIHMSPAIIHQAVYKAGLLNVDGHWETPNGHLVVTDAGYINSPPPTGESPAPIDTTWIYASGNVEYQYAEPQMTRDGAGVSEAADGVIGDSWMQHTDIAHNRIERITQSTGILIFDPCPVTAVLTAFDAS